MKTISTLSLLALVAAPAVATPLNLPRDNSDGSDLSWSFTLQEDKDCGGASHTWTGTGNGRIDDVSTLPEARGQAFKSVKVNSMPATCALEVFTDPLPGPGLIPNEAPIFQGTGAGADIMSTKMDAGSCQQSVNEGFHLAKRGLFDTDVGDAATFKGALVCCGINKDCNYILIGGSIHM